MLWGPPCRPPSVWRISPLRWWSATTSLRWRSGMCHISNCKPFFFYIVVVACCCCIFSDCGSSAAFTQVRTCADLYWKIFVGRGKKDMDAPNVASCSLPADVLLTKWDRAAGDLKAEGIWWPCVYRSSKELLLQPVVISRNDKEKVFIEGSINSVRVSIAVKQVLKKISTIEYVFFQDLQEQYLKTLVLWSQADEIEKILCHKFMRFMMMRAENFFILRRKPVEVGDKSVQLCLKQTTESLLRKWGTDYCFEKDKTVLNGHLGSVF